jgi:hypothetical protein
MIDRRSKDKGSGGERATVTMLQVAGLATVRVPLTGLAGAGFMPIAGRELCCLQTAAGADRLRKLYDWLTYRNGLEGDQQAPVIIARLSMAAALLARTGKETKQ